MVQKHAGERRVRQAECGRDRENTEERILNMSARENTGRGGRRTSADALDEKIQKAQERVESAKIAYESATKNLQELLDKRDALRKDELYLLFLKSDKTYDEVVRFLKSGDRNMHGNEIENLMKLTGGETETTNGVLSVDSDMEMGWSLRDCAVQYCINQGTGIVYGPESGAYTTEAELYYAKEKHVIPWYVDKKTANFWIKGLENGDELIQYAVENNIDLLDYDEWYATREVFGAKLSYDDSKTINMIFWDKYDYTPLDAPDTIISRNDSENPSMADILGLYDLDGHDEAEILKVLEKYPEAMEKFPDWFVNQMDMSAKCC